ncbi:unnamed protein product [Timema podura]|uniref:BTB domain-containing protein n=1 Tax=Timema podura TaxID=61482 RepID=A0ABN7P8D2_TIMPD|nr:unnamed protein product [Timema podura]
MLEQSESRCTQHEHMWWLFVMANFLCMSVHAHSFGSCVQNAQVETESVAKCTNRRYDGYRPTIQPQVEQPHQQHTAGQLIISWYHTEQYQHSHSRVFMDHLSSEQLVDCTLSCQGQFLKAHKMVLSACSPYFQTDDDGEIKVRILFGVY